MLEILTFETFLFREVVEAYQYPYMVLYSSHLPKFSWNLIKKKHLKSKKH